MDETKENKSVEERQWRNFKMENIGSSSKSRHHGKTERLQKPDESLLAPRDWEMFLPTLHDLHRDVDDRWS